MGLYGHHTGPCTWDSIGGLEAAGLQVDRCLDVAGQAINEGIDYFIGLNDLQMGVKKVHTAHPVHEADDANGLQGLGRAETHQLRMAIKALLNDISIMTGRDAQCV